MSNFKNILETLNEVKDKQVKLKSLIKVNVKDHEEIYKIKVDKKIVEKYEKILLSKYSDEDLYNDNLEEIDNLMSDMLDEF